MESKVTLSLNPEEILFTQDSIKPAFSNGEPLSDYIANYYRNKHLISSYQQEKLDKLNNRKIRVTRYQEKIFTLNNRTLTVINIQVLI